MADRLMASARDKALQEISKLSPEARAYLTALAKKSNAMNQRSMGSGDEYVKGQIRASKGTPKRVQKAAPKKATGSASKSVAARGSSTSRAASSRSSARPMGSGSRSAAAGKPKNQTTKKAASSSSSSRPVDPATLRQRRPEPAKRSGGQFKKTYLDPFGRAGRNLLEKLDG